MNLMKVDGYQAKISTTKNQINFAGRFLGFLEERTSMDQAQMSFVVSSRNHWRFFLRSVRSKELSHAGSIQASSICEFLLNCTKSLRSLRRCRGRVSTRSLRKHSSEVSRHRETDNKEDISAYSAEQILAEARQVLE